MVRFTERGLYTDSDLDRIHAEAALIDSDSPLDQVYYQDNHAIDAANTMKDGFRRSRYIMELSIGSTYARKAYYKH